MSVRIPTDVTRVGVDLRGLQDRPTEALRVLLVADVLMRNLEDLHRRALLLSVVADPSADLLAAARALSIRDPFTRTESSTAAAELLGGSTQRTLIVRPRATSGRQPSPLPGRPLEVGAVGAVPDLAELVRGPEVLSVRLALLRFRHDREVSISRARLHRAQETLQRWRSKVADWADMPSAPAPEDIEWPKNALDDLDTGAALTWLHRLEVDPRAPSGAKFEAFMVIDRVLALDLSHLVGRRPAQRAGAR
jgi:hypothetical protein